MHVSLNFCSHNRRRDLYYYLNKNEGTGIILNLGGNIQKYHLSGP